jgi:serine O-acetyltransferase
MEQLTDLLLQDYGLGRPIDVTAGVCRPDAEAVEQLLQWLRMLLFPGYFRCESNAAELRSYISMLLGQVRCCLESQIFPLVDGDAVHCAALCRRFLYQIPQLRQQLQLDLQAFVSGDPAATGEQEIIIAYPGYYAICVYRLAHALHGLGLPLLPRMMTELSHSRTGIDIHPGAEIAPAFFIDHGTGIVIGETATIGTGVKLYQGVTLGALSTRGGRSLHKKKRHPTIGDAVTIYAGATVLGGETLIGEGAVIGANAFVTGSVPPGQTVIGHLPGP